MSDLFDLAIIGGGVNGCGIARDAAGRGASVLLGEMGDLAQGTSSASTKLIHGGLRYLEYYEFRLVREALKEREVLWQIAPHIVEPLRFVLPYHSGLRPAWMLRLGLLIYDNLGGRNRLPATRRLDLSNDTAGAPLRSGLQKIGFEYSDCRVDDSRLVALNARDAADRGAEIRTRTRVASARVEDGLWHIELEGDCASPVCARVLVNASGPWLDSPTVDLPARKRSGRVRLVQGTHITVPKLFDHDRCYIFQNSDNRVVFAIPYEDDFTLIGTTDVDFTGDPATVSATAEEVNYLCDTINGYLDCTLCAKDVVWAYSGLRPLYDDGASTAQAATRDYVLDLDTSAGAPLLTVIGGKITTYRKLSEQAVDQLAPFLPEPAAPSGWTGHEPLPGGDFPVDGRPGLEADLAARYPWLASADRKRLVRTYGTRVPCILGDACGYTDLGEDFGAGLHAAEVRYLMQNEWARSAEDVLWRRSKLGLRMSDEAVARLDAFMQGCTGD